MDIQTAVHANDWGQVLRLSKQLSRELSQDLGDDSVTRLTREMTDRYPLSVALPAASEILRGLETNFARKDHEGAYRQNLLLTFHAHRYLARNQPDPMLAFVTAQQRAASAGTFLNYYALALAASQAKQNWEAIDAATKALKLIGSGAPPIADTAHTIHQVIASSYLELGRYDLAEQALLESLDGSRQWMRPHPDFRVANKLLSLQKREGVIRYLEKAVAIQFPKSQALMESWLLQLRNGGTPNLTPPSPI